MSIEALNWALTVPVGGTQKVVLLGLANHAASDGDGAWPSIAKLATYAHCSERTVQRTLTSLMEDGWIEATGPAPTRRADRAPTVYRLGLTGCQSVTSPADGVTSTTPRGDIAVSPEPSIEPSTSEPTVQTDVSLVFEEWKKAFGKSDRTVLDDKRRRVIQRALKLHPLDVCVAAVRNLAADPWPERKRFDDLKYALKDAATIEKWATEDATVPTDDYEAERAKRDAALRRLMGANDVD